MAVADELRAALTTEQVRTGPADLAAVARDGSHLIGAPDVVVYPTSAAEVAAILRIASSSGTPVVPRGGGTSLAASTVPNRGGIVIATNRMRAIIELDPSERSALVQPGIANAALDRAARAVSLRYAPDPSSRAVSTIGGNVGTNAGGLHCLGHGVTGDHVLGLEVALSTGEICWLDDQALPDLRALVVGGEGQLAVVTAVLCRLLPLAERTGMVIAAFPGLAQAGAAAERLVLDAPGLVACEFIDRHMLDALAESAPGSLPGGVDAVLIIEVEALREGIDEAISTVRRCVEDAGGTTETRLDEVTQAQAWDARRGAAAALGRLYPDSYTHDFATPRDRIVESLQLSAVIAERHGLVLSSVAHLGDGNLHPRLHYDATDPAAFERAMAASDELLEVILANGGTLTGEHGIGLEKLGALGRQYGELELAAMRAVRAAFDPSAILNPGKTLPDPGFDASKGMYAAVS